MQEDPKIIEDPKLTIFCKGFQRELLKREAFRSFEKEIMPSIQSMGSSAK